MSTDEIIDISKKLLREFTEEGVSDNCRKAWIRWLENIPSIVISGNQLINFHRDRTAIDSLIEIVTSPFGAAIRSLLKGSEFQNIICSSELNDLLKQVCGCSFDDLSEKIHQCRNDDILWNIFKLIKLRAEFRDGIERVQQIMSDNLLKSCAAAATLIIISESCRIFMIWHHIKDAENCIFDNVDKHQIELNITKIERKINELVELQVQFTTSTDVDTMRDINDETEGSLIEIRSLLTKTIMLIGKVKADINGKKELLLADDLNLTVSLATNVVQSVVNGFHLLNGFSGATSFWKVASGVAFIGLSFVVGTNVVLKIVTKDTIMKCRAMYQEMSQLAEKVVQYETQAEDIRKWLRRTEKQLRKKVVNDGLNPEEVKDI